jgi:hypothetical protein
MPRRQTFTRLVIPKVSFKAGDQNDCSVSAVGTSANDRNFDERIAVQIQNFELANTR